MRAEGAVDDAVVAREGQRHGLADHNSSVFNYRLSDGGPHGEDGGVWRIDNRAKFRNAHHAEVGNAERAAREFFGLKLLLLGPLAEWFDLSANRKNRFEVGIANHRGDEPIFDRHRKRNVRGAVVLDA